jgi:hypothetical protein
MKAITPFLATIITTTGLAFSAASGAPSQGVFLSGAAISAAIKELPANATVDQPLRALSTGAAIVGIFIVHRPEEADAGCTIEHDTLVNDKTTSIVFVLDGAGTLVTGGKLAHPTQLAATDPDLKLVGSGSRGSGIKGGKSRRISKGDIVIIPAGVPHGFSAIEKSITYQVVRVDWGKTLAIK